MTKRIARLGVAALICGACGWASSTAAWEMNTYSDFIRGRFRGVSLTRDGRLMLAPELETVFSSDQPIVWSAARAADGTVYAATGHRGRVYRIDAAGKSSLLWTADQPEVFALALGANGVLYAGSSPDGKVWRIEHGKAAEYFAPKAKYIWSLAVGPDGALYVGTGDQGKVYKVTAPGQGELYYDTGQSHITSLAVDPQGRLLAGTEPNGILYRITAKDKAFALYDANLPEIRAILPQADGSVYAAALGGSVARRIQSATQAAQASASGAAVTAAPTTITVEASAAQAGAEFKPEQPKPAQPAPATQVTTQFSATVDLSGVEKSAVFRINPDNTVETLWSSKEENVYDLLAQPGRLLLSTDGNGRIYSLTPDRKATLLAQTNDAEATRLLPAGGAVLASTGNMGRIYRLGDGAGGSGSYESPVYDTGSASRWGSLSWRMQKPAGCSLKFETRAGNSSRPDKSWSDWSEELVNAAGSKITSPNARYIQWRAEFAGTGGHSPQLDNVTVAYLPQNSPPVVKSINVTTQTSAPASGGAKPAAGQGTPGAYTVTVSDTGETSASTPPGTPTTVLPRSASPQVSVTWQAEDADGDRMVYTLYFRGEEEQEWKLLKGNLHENTFSFDADALADGKYFFRVAASDREANPPAAAREGELVSAPVLIDNTPPVVTMGPVRRSGTSAHVEFEAADSASPLRRCEYSLDAGTWVPVEAADGVIDSERERFALDIANLPPGEHLLVVRAVDSSNNAGLAKAILR